ncbi:MAG: hypothetical protein IPO40_04375 [Fibrobacteres bacterium]|nr:hypothetical protein [Fibrobacterota bacterium]
MSSLLLLMSANGCIGDEVGESRYGGFRPVKSSPARLVAETLSVVLEANRASFKARYWVDNPGDTLRSKYGVPIDHTPASMAMDDIGWEPRLFSDSRLSIDGQPAVAMDSGRETKTVFTLPPDWDPEQPAADTSPREVDGWRRWFTSSIRIPPGLHLIELESRMSAFYSDYSGKESKFEGRSSVRNFLWDLSPAGGWGKGVVEQLLVRVDVRALLRDSMPIRLQGLPFLLEDSVYVATVHRFALKSAQPLQFSWNPHPTQYRRLFHSSLMENPKWRASTGVAAYPVSNLDDRNLSTAWVAPAGSGEVWLETDLPRGFGPTAVAVCAGYAKSTTTLVGNARPQEITMTWTPAEITYVGGGTVDTAKLGFEDRDHIRELLAPKTTDLGDGCYLDAPPKALEEMNPAILQFWEGTYWRSGGKIRFDFKRPKPGKKSQDMAISEILFLY